jgi:hypothetical protein
MLLLKYLKTFFAVIQHLSSCAEKTSEASAQTIELQAIVLIRAWNFILNVTMAKHKS